MTRTSLSVDYDSHVDNLGGRVDDDEWSRDSTSTTWTVTGVNLGEDHHQLSLEGEVRVGDVVWLVYAVWSDGDSFGHDDGARIDFVTVHRDGALAHDNAQLLSDVNERAGYGRQVFLTLDDGSRLPYTVPWLGYFESLDYVRCQAFVVGASGVYRPRRQR